MSRFIFASIVCIISTRDAAATSWWSSLAVGFSAVTDGPSNSSSEVQMSYEIGEPFCRSLPGLSDGQRRICDLFFDHMPPTALGAKFAIGECQYQFRTSRWNCSSPYEYEASEGRRVTRNEIGPQLNSGTREAAFTYAIISAGVAHQVARACKRGQMETCGCSEREAPPSIPQYQWGGCGDNVEYGYNFAKEFVDVREKEQRYERDDPRYGHSLMNRWNNEAGRALLKRMVRARCKCHGLSGSCEVRTCWVEMPPLRDVGAALQNRYRQSKRVRVNAKGNLQLVAPINRHYQPVKKKNFDTDIEEQDDSTEIGEHTEESVRMRRYDRSHRYGYRARRNGAAGQRRSVLRQDELIYIDESPDYCRYNPLLGVAGTHGRECVANGGGADSCRLLCCGRGYNTHTEVRYEECNCTFQWCCEVVCEQCNVTTVRHTCK